MMPAPAVNKRTGVNEHLQPVMDSAKRQPPRQFANAARAQNVKRTRSGEGLLEDQVYDVPY